MKRRRLLCTILAVSVAPWATPSAAQSNATPLIGILDAGERQEWWNAFKQRLAELGYVAGRTPRFDARYARGDLSHASS